ncbi:MAG: HlyD family secretion protein, partial [Bacteroidales bacterium]
MTQTNDNQQHAEKHKILRKRKYRNIFLNTLCMALALSGLIYGVHYFLLFYRYEVTNDAIIDQYIVPVNCKAGGFVHEIRFTEHQSVKKGDTLLIIDPQEYIIKVAEAKAALLQAQANNEALIAGALSSESNVAVSQSRVKEREAYLMSLSEKEKRYRMLYQKGAVSRQDMEQVISDYQASLANLSALKLEEKASKAILSENQKKQLSGIASIDERVAELDLALTNLSYTVITAPRDGIMGRRNIET